MKTERTAKSGKLVQEIAKDDNARSNLIYSRKKGGRISEAYICSKAKFESQGK